MKEVIIFAIGAIVGAVSVILYKDDSEEISLFKTIKPTTDKTLNSSVTEEPISEGA